MAKTRITNTRTRLLSELKVAKGRGRTVQEITTKYDMNRGSVSSRMSELVNSGDVVVIGTRNNTQGVPVSVYGLPQFATTT